MESDDFEQKLRERPFRELPREWHNRILATAKAASAVGRMHSPKETPLLVARDLRARFAAILWPTPKAWTGLVFVWLLLVVANQIASNHTGSVTGTGSRPGPAAMAEWKEEERILAELIQPAKTAIPESPRHVAPQPRSEVLRPYRTI